MALPKSLTTVTRFSKFVALSLFIILPFAGFYLGIRYQQKIDAIEQHTSNDIVTQQIYTEKDNNKTISLSKGQIFSIVLHSTYWKFDQVNGTAVQQIAGPVYAADQSVQGIQVPGSGRGTITTQYKVIGSGNIDIIASRKSCGEALLCSKDQSSFVLHVIVQ